MAKEEVKKAKPVGVAAPGDEEESFPRGGGVGLAPIVAKQLRQVSGLAPPARV